MGCIEIHSDNTKSTYGNGLTLTWDVLKSVFLKYWHDKVVD